MIKFEVLKQIAKNLENTEYGDILKLLKGTLISRIRRLENTSFQHELQITYTKENMTTYINSGVTFKLLDTPN